MINKLATSFNIIKPFNLLKKYLCTQFLIYGFVLKQIFLLLSQL